MTTRPLYYTANGNTENFPVRIDLKDDDIENIAIKRKKYFPELNCDTKDYGKFSLQGKNEIQSWVLRGVGGVWNIPKNSSQSGENLFALSVPFTVLTSRIDTIDSHQSVVTMMKRSGGYSRCDLECVSWLLEVLSCCLKQSEKNNQYKLEKQINQNIINENKEKEMRADIIQIKSRKDSDEIYKHEIEILKKTIAFQKLKTAEKMKNIETLDPESVSDSRIFEKESIGAASTILMLEKRWGDFSEMMKVR